MKKNVNTVNRKKSIKNSCITVAITAFCVALLYLIELCIIPLISPCFDHNVPTYAWIAKINDNVIPERVFNNIFESSVDSIDDIESIQRYALSVGSMIVNKKGEMSLQDLDSYGRIEYIKKLNDKYFCVVYKYKDGSEPLCLLCFFFRLDGRIYEYTGKNIIVQAPSKTKDVVQLRINMSYNLRESNYHHWYGSVMQNKHPFRGGNTASVEEYFLLSDSVFYVKTDAEGKRKEYDFFSNEEFIPGAGDALGELFATLREFFEE